MIKTLRSPQLPPMFMGDDVESMRVWLQDLHSALNDSFRWVFMDFADGNSRHRIYTSAPGTSDVEEGEVVFLDDGATTRRLYTKLNGVMRYCNLT